MTRRLPIGIQSFRRLRETNSYYVDKTPFIRDLIDKGDYWFLSRPRRFGKSLLLDTIRSLFEGHESLFQGLDIHRSWDWSAAPHPVLRLSFGGKYNEPGDIERNVLAQLAATERNAGLPTSVHTSGPECLLDDEDRSRIRTGHGPANTTLFRRFAIGLIRQRGLEVAEAMRAMARKPRRVLDMLRMTGNTRPRTEAA